MQISINQKEYEVVQGACLGDVLSAHGLMAMPCGKHGKCGKCRVTAYGELSPVSDTEKSLLTAEDLARGVRLACCTYVLGTCTVFVAAPGKEQICTHGMMPAVSVAPDFLAYGVAIDIGTTTLAARLYDATGKLLAEDSRRNPQNAWGADVISRVEAAMSGKEEALAESILQALDDTITGLAKNAGVVAHAVDGIVLTGNTAMLYLLTKNSVIPLSRAPFVIKHTFGETLSAETLGLRAVAPETRVYIPPCLAAFVGADTVTAVLASGLCEQGKTRLLADIGTNGEMALWHKDHLYVCSTAAGPAFEGVGISMGMSGMAGAIDRVELVNGMLAAHVIGEEKPVGICGSGIVDAVSCLLSTETIDESGFLEDDVAEISYPVSLSQKDIRMVQLAKSAVCAGIHTLVHTADITYEDVESLSVAGGFGSYLNVKNAVHIGLLPRELTGKIRVTGNAALMGACLILLDKSLRTACEQLLEQTTVTELSQNPFFMDAYVNGMMFDRMGQ